jgi:predicted transcriptional regulator
MLLWLLLLAAIGVREIARAIFSAWESLEWKGMLLLPTGGIPSFADMQSTERAANPGVQWKLAAVGPIANIAVGLVLLGLMLTLSPGLSLLSRPWLTPAHLLRSAAWMQILLGVANLLPASPLDGGRVLRGLLAGDQKTPNGLRLFAGLGRLLAFCLIVGGISAGDLWITALGVVIMFGPRLESDSLLLETDVDAVTMRDVMLENYSTLSAADTLEGALESAMHSLQDVFPVVRGSDMVGAVSRQGIIDALERNGNGYIQGVMTRALAVAAPEDSLIKTLRRMMGNSGVQLVPVVEGNRVVGILTPQNLSHSMRMLQLRRRLQRRG